LALNGVESSASLSSLGGMEVSKRLKIFLIILLDVIKEEPW
jgi:hypothetical protein